MNVEELEREVAMLRRALEAYRQIAVEHRRRIVALERALFRIRPDPAADILTDIRAPLDGS